MRMTLIALGALAALGWLLRHDPGADMEIAWAPADGMDAIRRDFDTGEL